MRLPLSERDARPPLMRLPLSERPALLSDIRLPLSERAARFSEMRHALSEGAAPFSDIRRRIRQLQVAFCWLHVSFPFPALQENVPVNCSPHVKHPNTGFGPPPTAMHTCVSAGQSVESVHAQW